MVNRQSLAPRDNMDDYVGSWFLVVVYRIRSVLLSYENEEEREGYPLAAFGSQNKTTATKFSF